MRAVEEVRCVRKKYRIIQIIQKDGLSITNMQREHHDEEVEGKRQKLFSYRLE